MKKKIISFFLCFLLIFSFPFSVSAADDSITFSADNLALVADSTAYGVIGPVFDGSLQLLPTDYDVTSNQVTAIQFIFSLKSNFTAGDQITTFATSSLGGVAFTEGYYMVHEENSPGYTKVNVLSGDGIAVDYTVKTNCNRIRFVFYSTAIKHSGNNTTASTRLKVTYNFTSADIGLLNSIIEYVKGIFSDIQDLPNKISDFFADLKNNLSSLFADVGEWFSQLGDNLKQWFESVGEWFSQLGDNLKQWFEDVGNWFSELFSNISAFFTGLWDDFTEWFKSLFIPRDGYFSEMFNLFGEWLSDHLGFLAQSADVITSLINTISNLDGSSSGVIVFPEIRLPFLDNPLIMERQEFDLLSYINSISVLKQIYQIYQLIVTALFTFLFVKYAYRKFEEILKGREVTD